MSNENETRRIARQEIAAALRTMATDCGESAADDWGYGRGKDIADAVCNALDAVAACAETTATLIEPREDAPTTAEVEASGHKQFNCPPGGRPSLATEDAAALEISQLPRFEDRGETVYDHQTGLEWEKATRDVPSWHDGLDSCAALRVAGHDDWRLPTTHELLTIVDYARSNPACDPVFQARSYFHWSSSTYRDSENYAWGVFFYDGGTYANGKTDGYSVRAVRAGSSRIRSFDNSTPSSVGAATSSAAFGEAGTLLPPRPDALPPVYPEIHPGDTLYTDGNGKGRIDCPHAPAALPPLVLPFLRKGSWYHGDTNEIISSHVAACGLERIARDERAARERERADAAQQAWWAEKSAKEARAKPEAARAALGQ